MLLTQERIKALSYENRFGGWTNRPYSVLEHSVIGAKILAESNAVPVPTIRAFLLHDMHETAFGGDITTPIKRKYLGQDYHDDVRTWDRDLATETSVPLHLIEGLAVKFTDAVMLAAETRTVSTGGWIAPIPEHYEDEVQRAQELIRYEFYRGDLAVQAFWQMWSGS